MVSNKTEKVAECVTPRKRRVSRNLRIVESKLNTVVTPRKRRVSRNSKRQMHQRKRQMVTPRKRRVSRNRGAVPHIGEVVVTPRKRRVSRNLFAVNCNCSGICHASQEACE